MSSKKEHYLVTKNKKEDQILLPYFKSLYVFKNTLYNQETLQKMFIFDCGQCVKGDCYSNYTSHKVKVLTPKNILSDLVGEITSEDTVGRIVICFSHFKLQDQITYLKQGSFPEEVSLLRTTRKPKPDVEPKPKKTRICAEAINKDSSWVTILNNILLF